MTSKTYTIDNNYQEWAKKNPCVEHLILKGVLPVEQEEDFERAFAEISFKSIDISDFTIEIDGKKYETDYESWWHSFSEPLTAPHILKKIIANKEFSTSFHWENGFLLDESGTVVIDTERRDIMEVPQGITVIGHFAFIMHDFKKLKLPDSLLTIGRYAFSDSVDPDFTEVFIPDSVKTIGESAFSGCNLEKVRLPANLETIPRGCFNYNWLTSIELPKTLKHIGDEAFRSGEFEEVFIPEGVEDIGADAFENLRRISLPSTLKELAKDFYYEACVDDPESCLPFVEVHPDNPCFFAKDGTLYKRDDASTPYLGCQYTKHEIEPEPNPCGDCSQCPYNREYDKETIDRAFATILEEAENGDAEKQVAIAAMYTTDMWIEHDYEKAYFWFSKAAQQGSCIAMEALADAYYAGTWLEQDYGKAVEWLQKAADKGYAKAVNNLASCYEEGKGVEMDLKKALQLYLKAVEMDYNTAEEDVKRLQAKEGQDKV